MIGLDGKSTQWAFRLIVVDLVGVVTACDVLAAHCSVDFSTLQFIDIPYGYFAMRCAAGYTDPFSMATSWMDSKSFDCVVGRQSPGLEAEKESKVPEVEDSSGSAEEEPAMTGVV